MSFRRMTPYALIALMVAGLAGCNVTAREPGRYYDRGSGFSIKFPEGWKKIDPLPGAAVTMQDTDKKSALSIAVQKVPAGSRAEELIRIVAANAQSRGIAYKDRGQMSIDGHDAYWMVGDAGVSGYIYIWLIFFLTAGSGTLCSLLLIPRLLTRCSINLPI